jgi:hypothetical protein
LAAVGNPFGLVILLNLEFAAFGAGIVAWGVSAMQRGEMTPIQRSFALWNIL